MAGTTPIDSTLPILNSPSISLPLNFSREATIAYQTPSGHLMCLVTGDGQNSCPGAAMDPDGSGEIQVSFRAVTSALWRVTPDISFQESWTVGVAAGSTPSVMPYILAFQGSDGHLWTEASFAAPVQSAGLMAAGTSPDLY